MGKKSAIDSLSRIISNIAIHEILVRYTNKPESINYLNSEILEYRDVAFFTASKFNWNKEDLNHIKSKSLDLLKKEMPKRYPDVKYPEKEVEKIIGEIIKNTL